MNTYLCYLEYFATGEGLTYVLAHIIAEDENKAKDALIKQHMDSNEYFKIGVEVLDLSNKDNLKKAQEWLSYFLKDSVAEGILKGENAEALHEFYFKSYVNYS